MTFAKPEKKQESSLDEEQRLMCSVPGCTKRWTVHISGDRPKCSHHQWSSDSPRIPAKRPSEPRTVAQWYEKEDF